MKSDDDLLVRLLVHHNAACVVVLVVDEFQFVHGVEGDDQVPPTAERAGGA